MSSARRSGRRLAKRKPRRPLGKLPTQQQPQHTSALTNKNTSTNKKNNSNRSNNTSRVSSGANTDRAQRSGEEENIHPNVEAVLTPRKRKLNDKVTRLAVENAQLRQQLATESAGAAKEADMRSRLASLEELLKEREHEIAALKEQRSGGRRVQRAATAKNSRACAIL